MNVVVVESPAKAKTINKYLGKDFEVLASFGHVRDLPSKDGSVRPDDDFAMTYEIDPDSKKQLAAIAKAVKNSDTLYLATDPDREGEAISWHVLEALKESKAIKKGTNVKRVVFHEITKNAVLDAIANPRDIDMNLVNAQQARRALDYLVGFNLSPVLWRKLPGSRSAGRVQSVALRLICERDEDIEKFVTQEYWDIRAELNSSKGSTLSARLTHWKSDKLEKFSITAEKEATAIAKALESKQFSVSSVEPKQSKRNPYAPFTTSTLQQDASRKLGFGAKKTMQLAQKLYEGVDTGGETAGLITYMRTDSVSVSQDAITSARELIGKKYGKDYLPASPRIYKTKSKNAQEAHEAIRPTDLSRLPEQVEKYLDRDMFRLYDLIWKRMLASQMESAVLDQVVVDFTSHDKEAVLRTNGSVIKFDGFLCLYTEGKDDGDEEEEEKKLPVLTVGEACKTNSITPEQHFTEPPPRYTEASLVKKLEELGIGRPSTYASIISVLQDRGYVKLDKKRFTAEVLGRLVNAFLVSFFERYVQYDFTADLENRLDDVSAGEEDWKALLRDFWTKFIAKVEESKKINNLQVLETLDSLLEPFLFGKNAAHDARNCPSCAKGRLSLKTGKFGAFLACSNYPDCNFTKQLSVDGEAGQSGAASEGDNFQPRELGVDEDSGLPVLLKKGPYGFYVQLGDKEKKPKRASLLKTMDPEALTFEAALALLSLPREIGLHPESKKMISAGIGRFGPYLLVDGKYTSIPAGDDVLSIGINRAVDILSSSTKGKTGGGSSVEPLRIIGDHPEEGGAIAAYSGRYGPYIKHGKINASLPRGSAVESFTLDEAVKLLAAKKDAPPAKKVSRGRK